ncbi:hypothetical protein RYX36_034073, partial [Vicia faba]
MVSSHETTSSHTSPNLKRFACKRRLGRVHIRRKRTDLASIGFPLGMAFATVIAEVLYKTNAAFDTDSVSPTHISLVFGDKLDDLARNFGQSFACTLSTLGSIYESSIGDEGNSLNTMKMEFPTGRLTREKGDCSSDSVIADDDKTERVLSEEIKDRTNNCEEVEENFQMDSITHHDITLHRQPNQLVSAAEKSVMEESRANDLKALELALTMKKLKLKETQLVLNSDLNHLERSKLTMGMSKASFRVEKFKNQLEDLRHSELIKNCIDCLIAGLLAMSSSLTYGAYVYSYERIAESTASCTRSNKARIQVVVDSEINVLFQFKVTCFMVSSSSYEPNGIWCLNDFCNCIFANHEINSGIRDNASYFHSFAIRSCLWLLWQSLYRYFGREWLFVALILGDSVH